MKSIAQLRKESAARRQAEKAKAAKKGK